MACAFIRQGKQGAAAAIESSFPELFAVQLSDQDWDKVVLDCLWVPRIPRHIVEVSESN